MLGCCFELVRRCHRGSWEWHGGSYGARCFLKGPLINLLERKHAMASSAAVAPAHAWRKSGVLAEVQPCIDPVERLLAAVDRCGALKPAAQGFLRMHKRRATHQRPTAV